MAVRVTAAHTAEAGAEAGREAGEGGVAAAAALSSGGFLGLPAPFSEEGNEPTEAWCGRGAGGSVRAAVYGLARILAPRVSVNLHNSHRFPFGLPLTRWARCRGSQGAHFSSPLGSIWPNKHRSLLFSAHQP